MYIHSADIQLVKFMPGLLKSFAEGPDHLFCIAIRTGTAVQNQNPHFKYSLKKLSSLSKGMIFT